MDVPIMGSVTMRSVIVAMVAFLGATAASYDGYKLYKIVTETEAQNAFLKSLESHRHFDFWSSVNKVGNPVFVMVAPRAQGRFEHNLKQTKTKFSIEIENIERIIPKRHNQIESRKKSHGISFDRYLRHAEMNAYLAQLAADYPHLVTLETIGQSYEKRNMTVIRISSGSAHPPKPAVFIDAGIHAREWIAPAVALYLIHQLVENPQNRYLVQDVDWLILPSLNPDGYEFSWRRNRLWRATRSPGVKCKGCDLNRNFDFHWMEVGAEDYECAETYAGKAAFSEVETRNLRDYLTQTPNVQGYMSLHSFGQYVLYPWSYTDALPENADELQALGEQINDAIEAVNGTKYTVGSTAATLYPAGGSSEDWAMGVAGIAIAFTVELPGGGKIGFDMPSSQIKRVANETFEGFKVFGQYFASKKKD